MLTVSVLRGFPEDACSPIIEVYGRANDQESFALLVERGNCSFVTKANYAQIAGASAVIIIDQPKAVKVVDYALVDDRSGLGNCPLCL